MCRNDDNVKKWWQNMLKCRQMMKTCVIMTKHAEITKNVGLKKSGYLEFLHQQWLTFFEWTDTFNNVYNL